MEPTATGRTEESGEAGRSSKWSEAERREELWAIASHDLRGTLGNIKSYSGLLAGGRMAHPDPKVRKAAEVISRNSDKALRLIQLWFDSVRAETGALQLHPEPLQLQELLAALLAAPQPIAMERTVRIEADLPEAPLHLVADRERLKAILLALIESSVAREPAGGQVRLTAGHTESSIFVGLESHGAKLTPDELARLFDKEHQILRERKLGLGFALSVAQALAQAQGGVIRVESGDDLTRMELALPVGEA